MKSLDIIGRMEDQLNPSPHIRNIAMDLIITILTCGLYNIFIQAKQIDAVNDILKQKKYDFTHWLLLTIVTCGIYHCYHEYRMSDDLARAVPGVPSYEPIMVIVLLILGVLPIVDAIQQSHINRYYGSNAL
jgi:hypothetical protein